MRGKLATAAVVAAIALSGCSIGPVDKSGLQDLTDEATSMNISETSADAVEGLEGAVEDAQDVMDDEDATREEVDEAEKGLQAAIDAAESSKSVDEFVVTGASAGPANEYGYFEMTITVRNETDDRREFLGVDIAELDASGNIINSYMSYNKNYQPTVVDPGQELSIDLTCSASDGIAGVRCTEYEYAYYDSSIYGTLSEPFVAMF